MPDTFATITRPDPVQGQSQRTLAAYRATKLFNLAFAPCALQDAPELTPLRSGLADDQPGLLWIHVGRHQTLQDDTVGEGCRTVTLLDYMLQDWLMGHGATEGETVLLTWDERVEADGLKAA